MAKRKRAGNYKKKSYKKKKSYGVKKTVKRMFKKAGITQREVKHTYTDVGVVAITQSFTATPILILPTTQGTDGVGDFVGRQIQPKYIKLRAMFGNTGASSSYIRVLLIEDRQPAAAALLLYNATASSPYSVLRVQDINSDLVKSTDRRYSVKLDKIFNLCPDNLAATDSKILLKYIKLSKPIKFTPGSARDTIRHEPGLLFVRDCGDSKHSNATPRGLCVSR